MTNEDFLKLTIMVILLSTGCQHDQIALKKLMLLDWSMQPGSPLIGARNGSLSWYEKADLSSSSLKGQSCPTCGG